MTIDRKKHFLAGIIAFFIFFFSAIFITYPLIFHLGDRATGLGDELVIAWIQNWVIHALTTSPLSLFDANIYYPYQNTLAFSDLFLTSSLLSFIPLRLIGEPIAAVNFNLIFSLISLGFFIYLLSFYITKDFLASILSGLLVIFSPAILDKKVHLQILSIQWMALSILFFLMFIKSSKTRYLVLSALFFVLQSYNSFLPGYFLVFFFITALVLLAFYKRKVLYSLLKLKNVSVIIVTIALLIPIIIPYYKVSLKYDAVRDIRDSIHFALQPEDLLVTNEHSRLQSVLNTTNNFKQYPTNAEIKPGYLGFVLTLLTVICFIYFVKYIKKKDFVFNSFFVTSLIGLILSFGPALHLNRVTIHNPFPIILPYALFYYVLPGFKGFRNSSRWEVLFIICIAIVIGIILSKFLIKYRVRTRYLIYVALFLGVVLEFNFPMKFVFVPQKKDFPKEHSWLASMPQDSKSIIMPIYNWNMPYSSEEIKREYYSTIHFRKTVNGYSGFSPSKWQEQAYYLMENFPKQEAIGRIKKLKVDHIIIKKDEYNRLGLDGNVIIETIKNDKSLLLIKQFKDTYIFSFR